MLLLNSLAAFRHLFRSHFTSTRIHHLVENKSMVGHLKYLLLFFATLLCVHSCKVDGKGKDQIVKVEPEFTIDLFEKLAGGKTLTFTIKSIDLQDCLNYGIDASSGHSTSFIRLVINDIVEPENCDPGPAFASTEVDVTPLPNGNYDFQVVLKDAIFSEGKLDVSPEKYQVDMSTTNGFYYVHKELMRIQDQQIWGYVGYEDKDQGKPYADQFLADLASICSDAELQNGYYGYFNVDGHELGLIPAPAFTNFQEFAFQLDVDTETLKDLLNQYRNSAAGDYLTISRFQDGRI